MTSAISDAGDGRRPAGCSGSVRRACPSSSVSRPPGGAASAATEERRNGFVGYYRCYERYRTRFNFLIGCNNWQVSNKNKYVQILATQIEDVLQILCKRNGAVVWF